ncbi:MAG: bis(5'-nucleosyl)-tetraphosphatase (symmetrical) YqeK [Clostridium sp.]|jgi:nicotinate-nucleotide adenylyltransferase|nr:bis(5'-nucleosyl)-tetraphosphatase (symmetrical) YqeK [Clostridium sp.]
MRNEQLLRKILAERLSPARLAHSLNVAQSARSLARHYGADEEAAFFAGLAHDICKCDGAEKMTALLEKAGYSFLPCEPGNANLLHAPAGAELLQAAGLCDEPEILDAVRYHSTGRAGMSLLEKIIFTADLISADRHYPDVETVRRLAYEDLDGAVRYVLRYVVASLTAKGAEIHPNSLLCLEALGIGS